VLESAELAPALLQEVVALEMKVRGHIYLSRGYTAVNDYFKETWKNKLKYFSTCYFKI
jgi:hypothetical protein